MVVFWDWSINKEEDYMGNGGEVSGMKLVIEIVMMSVLGGWEWSLLIVYPI